MSDSLLATEELGARGATHPRVTLADIEGQIAQEDYINLGDAIESCNRDHPVPRAHAASFLFTLCVLTFKNGFTQIGYSAPASPENYDAEKGRVFARENAIRDAWPKFGFALRERLHAEAEAG